VARSSAFLWTGFLAFPALVILLAFSSCTTDRAAHRLASGITLRTQTQTNPPLHSFIAEIDLANPHVHIRVAPGGADPDGPGKWQTTLMQPTRIAAREGFDLVVNGDFFLARGVNDGEGTNSHYRADIWASVEGLAMTDGVVWSPGTNSRPCLVVHKDRSVSIERLEHPVPDDWEVISGNTMLVEHGAIVPHQNKAHHPRTIVGLNARRTRLIILVVDGRRPGVSVGMTYDEEAAAMLRLGCWQALNLDGGGSSVMAARDHATGTYHILNTPSDGRERAVANVLGITVNAANPSRTDH